MLKLTYFYKNRNGKLTPASYGMSSITEVTQCIKEISRFALKREWIEVYKDKDLIKVVNF